MLFKSPSIFALYPVESICAGIVHDNPSPSPIDASSKTEISKTEISKTLRTKTLGTERANDGSIPNFDSGDEGLSTGRRKESIAP